MKKRGAVMLITLAFVLAFIAFSTPAMANYAFDGWAPTTRTNGTINGTVFIDSVPWNGQTTLSGSFDVPAGTVKKAYLYSGIWGGSETYTGWVSVEFNGEELGPLHLEGEDDQNPNVWCTGYGKYWWWYDVTNLTVAGQTNTATVSKINGTIDGRVYGIVLVVVLENNSLNPIQYWINDGSDALNYVTPHNDGTTYFNGTIDTANVTYAELTMVHLTGYDPVCSNCLEFNGNSLDTSMVDSNTFEINSWDVTNYIVSSGNNAHYMRGDDPYVNICNAILTVTYEIPTPPEKPDLLVTAINAYHNNTGCPAWFNLSNEIDVTVKNNGTGAANESNVSLYIDGEFFGKLPVPPLDAGESATVTFKNWKPRGGDCLNPPCDFNWSYKDYNFTAIADCDGEVEESNETNNEMSVKDRACYNGYMADEPLENVAHGMLNGHLIFTTGDGVYTSLYSVGDVQTTHYDINLPDGATTKLALLYVYYTWCKPVSGVEYACPEMEVNITTPDGTTYTLPLERAYNDTKCTYPGAPWNYPWGTYVYNVTEYITANGTYTVTVKNVCTKCSYFCVAAPGLLILYEDTNAPPIEYWINEGADVLMGGRRYPTSSNLAWWECINNATFPASLETGKVANVTLGVVAPWGGEAWGEYTSYLFFNGIKLGTGVYHGYYETYDETIGGITMHIGSTNAQVGVNVTDVTAYYMNGSDNVVGQADDGDNMMPAGAFLIVTYKIPPTPPKPFVIYGWVNYSNGTAVLGPNVTITNLNTSEVFTAETSPTSNYYQVLTTSYNISAGDVLHFNVSDTNTTEFNHTVTQDEIDNGGFMQNITIIAAPVGLCGDVDCDGKVTMGDGRQIWMNIIYGADEYPLNNTWAADVDCDGKVTMGDGRQIWMNIIYGADEYPLNCCQ